MAFRNAGPEPEDRNDEGWNDCEYDLNDWTKRPGRDGTYRGWSEEFTRYGPATVHFFDDDEESWCAFGNIALNKGLAGKVGAHLVVKRDEGDDELSGGRRMNRWIVEDYKDL